MMTKCLTAVLAQITKNQSESFASILVQWRRMRQQMWKIFLMHFPHIFVCFQWRESSLGKWTFCWENISSRNPIPDLKISTMCCLGQFSCIQRVIDLVQNILLYYNSVVQYWRVKLFKLDFEEKKFPNKWVIGHGAFFTTLS